MSDLHHVFMHYLQWSLRFEQGGIVTAASPHCRRLVKQMMYSKRNSEIDFFSRLLLFVIYVVEGIVHLFALKKM